MFPPSEEEAEAMAKTCEEKWRAFAEAKMETRRRRLALRESMRAEGRALTAALEADGVLMRVKERGAR